ncbi:hypothetical protein [Desulfohalovibrio reitneri]|uniref:hypothetical protein n=1 Tax=Desulfohalovibrio reitneri TaxID=1307759 RepID=UPI0004A76740|nr:hypothetical protein [Desulfohalovibrio reitneri]
MQTVLEKPRIDHATPPPLTMESLAAKGPILAWLPDKGAVVVWEDHQDLHLYTLWPQAKQQWRRDADRALFSHTERRAPKGVKIRDMAYEARGWALAWMDEL